MDKKTSFILYPADFLAAVHNFRKSQIANFIIALLLNISSCYLLVANEYRNLMCLLL